MTGPVTLRDLVDDVTARIPTSVPVVHGPPFTRPPSPPCVVVEPPRLTGVSGTAHTRRGAQVKTYRRGAHARAGGGRAATNVYRIGRRGTSGDPFGGYLSGARQQIIDQATEDYRDIVIEVCRRNRWPIE